MPPAAIRSTEKLGACLIISNIRVLCRLHLEMQIQLASDLDETKSTAAPTNQELDAGVLGTKR